MAWCSGILFGEVYSAKGPIANAMVDIDWIRGEKTGLNLRIAVAEDDYKSPTYVQTDEDGKYTLPFVWFPGGSETSVTDSTKFLTIRTFAHSGTGNDRKQIKGCVCINIKSLLSQVVPMEFTAAEGAELGKSLIEAFNKIKAYPPFYKIFLSTEVKGIVAHTNFFV